MDLFYFCNLRGWVLSTYCQVSFGTVWPILLKLGILHQALVCSNADPRLTFSLFTQRSILVSYAFV